MNAIRGSAALILVLAIGGCTAKQEQELAAEPPCSTKIDTSALPTWARTGFSGDGSGNPHVFSKSGDMVGVLFGNPLTAPPATDHNNKILWVSKTPVTTGDNLKITAKLDGTGETAERQVDGGPGPSIIDLPKPGCWRFTLAWSGRTDTMDLTYSS